MPRPCPLSLTQPASLVRRVPREISDEGIDLHWRLEGERRIADDFVVLVEVRLTRAFGAETGRLDLHAAARMGR